MSSGGYFLTNAGSVDSDGLSEGSSAISIDSSYSESVACVRSEAITSSEALTQHFSRNISPTLFPELHQVGSDDPITLNAVYSVPGHHDACGGAGERHSARDSSGSCKSKQLYLHNIHNYTVLMYIPELGVENSSLLDSILRELKTVYNAVTVTL